jgi:hypothetical protein
MPTHQQITAAREKAKRIRECASSFRMTRDQWRAQRLHDLANIFESAFAQSPSNQTEESQTDLMVSSFTATESEAA